MNVVFKPLSLEDGKEVIAIFNYYVEHGFAAFIEEPIPREFIHQFMAVTAGYPAYVMKEGSEVLGFCFLRAYHPFPVFAETAEITYFIAPNHVRKGLGTQALSVLEKESRLRGIRHILASISSLNEASLTFHSKNGFKQCGTFQGIGKKCGTYFDVVWMQKEI